MANSVNSKAGQSKSNPQGIQVKAPPAQQYICGHVCRCGTGSVLVDRAGRILRQRCVTMGVRNDYAYGVQNVYLGEVGYDMTKTPPAPLMSANNPCNPSSFPLGAACREGLINLTKNELESVGGSAFRIPDVIKVINPSQPPVQANIDIVIEIKFEGDRWGDRQEDSYKRIAGGQNKLKLFTEKSCGCPNKEPKRVPVPNPVPVVVPQPKPSVQEKYYSPPLPDFQPTPAPSLSDYLIDTAKEVGPGLVLIVGVIAVIYLAPEVFILSVVIKTATQ